MAVIADISTQDRSSKIYLHARGEIPIGVRTYLDNYLYIFRLI